MDSSHKGPVMWSFDISLLLTKQAFEQTVEFTMISLERHDPHVASLLPVCGVISGESALETLTANGLIVTLKLKNGEPF